MPEIEESMMGVTFFVIERQSRIDMFDGFVQSASPPTHRPCAMVSLEQYLGAIQLTRNSKKIIRNLFRGIEAATSVMEEPKIRDGRRKLLRTLEPASDVSGALDDFAHLGRCKTMHVHQ